MSHERTRIVMLAGPGDSTRIVYGALTRTFGPLPLLLEEPIRRGQLIRRRAQKLGIRRALSQATFAIAVVPALRLFSRRRLSELRTRMLQDAPLLSGDSIFRVPSVNAPECIAKLRTLSPDVVVVNGTRIIAQRVLDEVPAVFINMHAGITPRYRGTHGAYWARAEGRPEAAGVTVHLVDKGIDTGSVLGQATIRPRPEDTFVTLPYLQIEAGIPLLIKAVSDVLAGQVRTISPLDFGKSKLWHHPGMFEYLHNWFRDGVR
jgi:methionyl-tRNA formyltransferase